ncbi:MAG: hypothetical protein ACOYL3_00400 [Desulfuromonadaceae bacterium]|jgi:hypothetical protein
MKTYLFNTENGLYEGETFENADTLQYVDGITPVRPPAYEHGQVPVFDPHENRWTVLPVSRARQLFSANRTMGSRS